MGFRLAVALAVLAALAALGASPLAAASPAGAYSSSWAGMPALFFGVPYGNGYSVMQVDYSLAGGGYEYVIADVAAFGNGSALAGSYAFSAEDVGASPVEVLSADVRGSGAVLYLVSNVGDLTAYVYEGGRLAWSGTYYDYITSYYVYIPGLSGQVAVYVRSPSGGANVSGGLLEYTGAPPEVLQRYFFSDVQGTVEGQQLLPPGADYVFLTAYGVGSASVSVNSTPVASLAFSSLAPFGGFPYGTTSPGSANLVGPIDVGAGSNFTVTASSLSGSSLHATAALLIFPSGDVIYGAYNFSLTGVGWSQVSQYLGYAPPGSSAVLLYTTSNGWGTLRLYQNGTAQAAPLLASGSGGLEGPGVNYYPSVGGLLSVNATCATGTTDFTGVLLVFRGRPPLFEPVPLLSLGSPVSLYEVAPEEGVAYVALMGFGNGSEAVYVNSTEAGSLGEPSGPLSVSLGTIRFEETGLPFGEPWAVTLAGFTNESRSSEIGFTEAAGSYGYSVEAPYGFTASPSSGVASTGEVVHVTFAPLSSPTTTTYTVTSTTTSTFTQTVTTSVTYTTTTTTTSAVATTVTSTSVATVTITSTVTSTLLSTTTVTHTTTTTVTASPTWTAQTTKATTAPAITTVPPPPRPPYDAMIGAAAAIVAAAAALLAYRRRRAAHS